MIPALSASQAFSLSTRVLLTLLTLSVVASEGFAQQVQIGPRTYSVAEIKLNDFTGNNQQYPAIVQLVNDNIAVGWESWYQVSSNSDCVGKLLAPDGSQIIGERLLNAFNTSGWEYGPAFAPQPDGGFIVAWGDTSADVHAQRFDASMNAVGGDFQLLPHDIWPVLATAQNGEFVVTGQASNTSTIYARRFAANGSPLSAEWTVTNSGYLPAAARASDGSFVIVWDSTSENVMARRYTNDGVQIGSDITVNTSVGGTRDEVSAVYAQNGDLIVAWHGTGLGDPVGVYLRRFAPGLSAYGNEVLVNDTVAGSQYRATLAPASGGGFVVSWCGPDGSADGVFLKICDDQGVPVDAEAQVSQAVAGAQVQQWNGGHHGTVVSGDRILVTWYGPGPGDSNGSYLTTLTPTASWKDLGFALAGSNGTPSLSGTGSLEAGTPISLQLSNAPLNAPNLLVIGLTAGYLPIAGGTLVPTPDVILNLGTTGGAGDVTTMLTMPADVPTWTSIYIQGWMVDPGTPSHRAASNALLLVTP